MLIDSHCHLDYIAAGKHGHPADADLAVVLERSRAYGVGAWINPGVTLAELGRVQALAEAHANVFYAASIHPCDVDTTHGHPHWLAEIETYLAHPKAVAVGETGLDYYYHPPNSPEASTQRTCFEQLLTLAQKHDLPLIIHDREAHDDIAAMVGNFKGVRGVMHCYSGDAAFADTMMALGFVISFAGNVTFKKATMLQEAAQHVPLSHLLVETDAPYLSPMPERGRPNEPYRTRFVAEFIAQLKGITVDELAEATTANTVRLFGLPQALAVSQPLPPLPASVA
jgi:TatD DNase family protein